MMQTTSTTAAAQVLAVSGQQSIKDMVAAISKIKRGFALVPPKEYKLHPDDLPALRQFATALQMPAWGNQFLPDLLGIKIVLDVDAPRLPRKGQGT